MRYVLPAIVLFSGNRNAYAFTHGAELKQQVVLGIIACICVVLAVTRIIVAIRRKKQK